MTKDAAPKQVATKLDVTLLKPHTHAGTRYATGDKIQVTEPERDWLAGAGIINKPAAQAKEGAK
ncbi:MAG: hypothetical protein CGU28_03125 [Candidatus Dactylopiibacterium carminicum]|uniref:DUF7210 domain-containing protein n=1 Tax=Candidatus Dactylopiibacterium carminicum TaxID=857335 RepID=A0A272EYE7_9RHOO|nr:hypothetical protein [Candidatus Dactylopiibacterium carminicum]KAF7600623.1 hypothetical protein BGI27_01700 [Candidatus Dactylopiibacterium carminicum]PAS95142.1 MAG: hypothetical protein CGU29_01470 [Candidatus Dactylopiibacterium carminicum]PAS97946.1 MAG: hypothetical protein CGU28_03125 [Candidatus Dactylopiibacterium carminicum]PAT00621.1 MAG: hypothetical protein BSR46_01710 [Candidatus Dactylopiibacterium carminicum]